MTDLRTAAQQALALIASARLCEVNSMSSRQEMLRLLIEATDILRAALAQQAEPVEPVGRVVSANCEYATVQWLKQTSDVGGGDPKNSRSWPIAGDAVYTAPPQRKPLTEEEIFAIENDIPDDVVGDRAWTIWFARAVERAHGIGRQDDNTNP